MLFTGDNVDYNILTIDWKGAFRGMGIIAALTPRKQPDIVVPRKQVAELHVEEHAEIGKVDYRFSNHARQSVKFLDLPKMPEKGSRVDLLWELSFSFQEPAPSWWRLMHILHQLTAEDGHEMADHSPLHRKAPKGRNSNSSSSSSPTDTKAKHIQGVHPSFFLCQ